MSNETKKSRGNLPRYTNHDGFLMPYGFPTENFDEALSYKVQDSDVFVATYPKCGTTWTQHIVYCIVNKGIPLAKDLKLTEVFPNLEEVGASFCERLENEPRLIKTHLPYEMTPMNENAKYIYITRNPKDCVVSFYFHTKGFVNCYDCADLDFDEFFKLFLEGKVDFGDYFRNLKSWLEHRNDDHVLFLTYEEMQQDYRGSILKIASFLGYADEVLANDEEILKLVMKECSFGAMQNDLLRWSSKRDDEFTPFIRRGKVGDWKNHLTESQSQALENKVHEQLSEEVHTKIWGD